jgi:hypothetical protein
MRGIAALAILSVVVIVAWPWLAGFLRSLSHTPPMNETVGAPRVDVEAAPSVVSPGEMVVIHVRARDAERARLAWRDTRARDIPDTERNVSLDGTVRWRLRVPDGLRPGSRALVVTAERGRTRSRVLVPVHVLDANGVRAHRQISALDLPDRPVVPEGTPLAARLRAAASFLGIFKPDEQSDPPAQPAPSTVREIDIARTPALPEPAEAEVRSAEAGMLGASMSPNPDARGTLFDPAPADEASAAS